MSLAATLLTVVASARSDQLSIEFNPDMQSRVVVAGQPAGPFSASDSVYLGGEQGARSFHFQSAAEYPLTDKLGTGTRTVVTGRAGDLVEEISLARYPSHPGWLFVQTRYRNEGSVVADISGYLQTGYQLATPANSTEPAFWSYQSASYESRPDWLLPVPRSYERANFLGMNASDYGGGTPVLDVWNRHYGIAIGHVELVPRQVSLPLQRARDGLVSLALRASHKQQLAPGASFDTVRGFVTLHRGDYFRTLREYSGLMQAQGIQMANAPGDAFEPIWCAWGYGREFTPQQVFETLPVAKRLGFRWAVLDDGWQTAIGDWTPVAAKFPNGDADMKALVDRIHQQGLKAQLWWSPLSAAPASATHREHPDWLLLDESGKPGNISWWDSHFLCPAYEPVRADAVAFVKKALGEWGFDGLKIDGQHLNAVPPCSNEQHHHASADEAPQQLPQFFRAVFEAAQATRPGSLVEICPCGTGYSFFTLPYMNMAVAADPESSWQVRLKGRTIKALAGDRLAFFGDHVELSDGGEDFASTLGIGGVVGTNFAWPGAPGKKDPKLLLSPAREEKWAFWAKLYEQKRLSEGEYLGELYDIAFDLPETHVVRKDGRLNYAFYARRFSGEVQFRGLAAGRYRIHDYEHDKDLGVVTAPNAKLRLRFTGALLVEAQPLP